MKNVLIKLGLITVATGFGLSSVSGAAQDDADMAQKLRELNIMDNIFEAALEEQSSEGFSFRHGRGPDSIYLADQGMVFRFRVLTNRPVRMDITNNWQEALNSAMEITRDSIEALERSFPDLDFDLDNEFLPAQPAMPAAPAMPTIWLSAERGAQSEAMRDMEEAMRETQEEIRDGQRELRNLQREQRNSDPDQDSIQGRINQLEARVDAQLANLGTQRESYETFVLELENARKEKQTALVDEASEQIISTLCDYGATLRSLGSNEHVTIILEDVDEDADQIYVFDYNELNDCRSAESLKQSAVSYLFRN